MKNIQQKLCECEGQSVQYAVGTLAVGLCDVLTKLTESTIFFLTWLLPNQPMWQALSPGPSLTPREPTSNMKTWLHVRAVGNLINT